MNIQNFISKAIVKWKIFMTIFVTLTLLAIIYNAFGEKYNINESEMNSFFDSISECLPVIDIINLNDTDPFSIDRAIKQKELDEINLEKAKMIYDYHISEGKSKQSAFLKLTAIEPFCYYKEQLKDYLKQNLK